MMAPRSVGRGAPAGGSASAGDARDRAGGASIPLRGRIPFGAPAPRFAVALRRTLKTARRLPARLADTWDLYSRLGFPVRRAWEIAGTWH